MLDQSLTDARIRNHSHRTALIAQVAFLLAATFSAAAVNLYVETAAHVGGAGGSLWQTDLEVQNVSDTTTAFDLTYLATSPQTVALTVPAGQAIRYVDVLGTLFGVTSGMAPLRISAPGDDLRASSRTSNQSSGGTCGQLVPVRCGSEAFASGESAFLLGLEEDALSRTNVGVLNTSDVAIDVELAMYDAAGLFLGTTTVGLTPSQLLQINRIFLVVTSSPVPDGYVAAHTTTGSGRFLTYASVVDNGSGDAWAQPGQPAPVSPEPVYVPFVAHDATWQSDVEVMAVGAGAASVTLELLATGVDNTSPPASSINLGAGTSTRLADVVASVFGVTGTGALRLTPTSGSILVVSRAYQAGLSHFVPARPASAAFTSMEQATVIGLTRSSTWQTDVGFVSTSPSTVTVEVALFAASGTPIATTTHPVLPYSHVQIADALGADVADAFALVRCTTPGGAILPYATSVDLQSGDAIHVAGQLYRDLAVIFADDFETGDATRWSTAVP